MNGYHYENWNGKRAYVRNGSRFDTHGGHAQEHQEEMAQIAQQVVIQTVPPMVEEIFAKLWNEAAERLIGAIEWDIQEVVSVAFDDMGEVFHSEKFRKVISSKIMEAIKKNIKGITIK